MPALAHGVLLSLATVDLSSHLYPLSSMQFMFLSPLESLLLPGNTVLSCSVISSCCVGVWKVCLLVHMANSWSPFRDRSLLFPATSPLGNTYKSSIYSLLTVLCRNTVLCTLEPLMLSTGTDTVICWRDESLCCIRLDQGHSSFIPVSQKSE